MTRQDRREQPAYSPAEASQYLGIPLSTIRYWAAGRPGVSKALISVAEHHPLILSFRNLVELHVLGSIRRQFQVSLPNVRRALQFVKNRFHLKHPLVAIEFQTDGVDLFVQRYGQLVNISREGQIVMRHLLASSLERIERDTRGLPIKLYPYTRNEVERAPRLVVIDPELSFGRPVLVGTGLSTEVIAERYKAGESMAELARDYNRPAEEIEEAIRCELEAA